MKERVLKYCVCFYLYHPVVREPRTVVVLVVSLDYQITLIIQWSGKSHTYRHIYVDCGLRYISWHREKRPNDYSIIMFTCWVHWITEHLVERPAAQKTQHWVFLLFNTRAVSARYRSVGSKKIYLSCDFVTVIGKINWELVGIHINTYIIFFPVPNIWFKKIYDVVTMMMTYFCIVFFFFFLFFFQPMINY